MVIVRLSVLFITLFVGILLFGCPQGTTHTISGIQELVLNEQDLQQLGMTRAGDCQTEDQTSINSLPVRYSMCNYTINSLNDTQVVIVLQSFTNFEDLNNSYQYDSLHLYSVQGLISENDFGDQSRFRVNNVNDYMGQLDEPGVYYYHLWICKDVYLIHITSSGRSKDAQEYVAKIGRRILSKFG